jgi:putative addiction module killer protein
LLTLSVCLVGRTRGRFTTATPSIAHSHSVSYSRHMVEVLTTQVFDRWLRKLKDRRGRLRILERIDRLTHDNPGDVKPVGQGVSELRLTYGPGYRVYYLQDGDNLVLLLCGGDKSTQQADIARAQELADEWHSREEDDEEED